MSVGPLAVRLVLSGAALAATIGAVQAGGFGGWSGDLQAGGIVIVTPKYEGSKEYEVIGFPIVAPAGSIGDGKVQFKGIDDLRYRLFEAGGFEFGPLAGYRTGRDEDDADRLEGLGDVDGGLVLGAYAAYRFGVLAPFVSYHHQVTGDDAGGLVRFGLEAKVQPASWLLVTALAGAAYADDDYMDAYFGVSERSRSDLSAFDAEAGIKDVYIGLSSDVPLDDRWTLKLQGKYSRLVGDAADSPIVETENQFSAGLGLTYRFNLSR